MADKSWSILSFTGTLPETKTLIDSGATTVKVQSLIIANYSTANDANITVERTDSADANKFKWELLIQKGNSPVALDSLIVLTGGDKLKITSDIQDVAVDANGSDST
jgi:hypothetical protein